MGMNDFAPYVKINGCFIVRNTTPDRNKTIKIFNYPILFNTTRDLLNIPGVSESDIRASLLKGELRHKIMAQDIVIECSDIDLLQFNDEHRSFLQNAGVVNGLEVGSDQITSELDARIASGGGGGEVVGTYTTAELSNQISSALVRTTTAGKVFNCTTIVVSISNASVNLPGELDILNGGSSGTVLLPITLASSSTQFTSQLSMSLNFNTPLQFPTNTYVKVVSGLLTYSITLVGYEV